MRSVAELTKLFESAIAKDAPPPKPVKGASVKCSPPAPPPDKPKLVAVEIPNNSVLAAKGMQYVNLTPADDKWKDGTKLTNQNRQTQTPAVLVRFDKPGVESFKIKIVPGGSNSAYSAAEEGRNANFKYEKTEKTYSTDADGTKTITDLQITCAGKDVFSYSGVDSYANRASSVEIETIRRVYIQELKMPGVPAANTLATFTGEFASHGIELVQLAAQAMTRLDNVGADTSTFETEARKAYVASGCSAKEPYVVALAYTGHLAVKEEPPAIVKADVEVAPGKAPVEIAIVGPNAATGALEARSLWKNIVTGEGWFIKAVFVREGETAADAVEIPAALVTAVPDDSSAPDDCTTVKIDVAKLTDLIHASALRKALARVSPFKGAIGLKVFTVNRMRGGISLGGGNLICVCARAWWRDKSAEAQNQTMIHEMGHKIGMVPDGTSVDATPNQYTGKGHRGSHCHAGLGVLADYGGVSGSTCVMFGATNGVSAFCADCAQAVKKVDLSGGWTAF